MCRSGERVLLQVVSCAPEHDERGEQPLEEQLACQLPNAQHQWQTIGLPGRLFSSRDDDDDDDDSNENVFD